MKYLQIFSAVSIAFTASLYFKQVDAFDSISLMQKLHREPPIPVPRNARRIPYQYQEQRVDNFDTQNFATYRQAYFENDEFFANDGPLFIFVGGEWAISPAMVLAGHTYDMAAELNGSLFYPEHRYYGHSFPTENLSVDNLRFLSVEQTLADLANFIVQIKRKQPRYLNSKTILVGGSYSATMVAWFRKQYPHLAVGAWASSAPLLAKVDFVEYKEIVGASIRSLGGQACYDRLENAFEQIEQLIAENASDEFRQQFGFCDDFGSHPMDVPNAINMLSNIVSNIVQYNKNREIQEMCDSLDVNGTASYIDAFAQFIRTHLDLGPRCMFNYWTTVQLVRDTSLSAPAAWGLRQWMYQTCTQIGWYQTSGSEYQPFGSSFPVDLFYNMCRDMYGDHVNQQFMHAAVDRTNVVFGGWDLDVKNVYFTHGSLDPWRAMGIQEDLNQFSPTDVIPGASHVADLSSISESNSPAMRVVKERIRRLVFDWIADV